MLRADRLRAAFAEVLSGSAAAGDPRFDGFVSSGVADRVDGRVVLSEAFVRDAVAALDARLGALAVLGGERIAVSDLPIDGVDAAVAAVARRVIEPGERVAESALNERLRMFVADPAFFRRRAVDMGVLDRAPDGSLYWRVDLGG
ncbi:DUF2087 domain-containing protein [Microbacterium radiodurans]|nr:DUF2087 domain-containing protein [Microbacterium radiodurans]